LGFSAVFDLGFSAFFFWLMSLWIRQLNLDHGLCLLNWKLCVYIKKNNSYMYISYFLIFVTLWQYIRSKHVHDVDFCCGC
jgi:hypothetical protein